MAATDQQLADKARASLERILDGSTAEWQDAGYANKSLAIKDLTEVIEKFEAKAAAASAGGGPRLRPIA